MSFDQNPIPKYRPVLVSGNGVFSFLKVADLFHDQPGNHQHGATDQRLFIHEGNQPQTASQAAERNKPRITSLFRRLTECTQRSRSKPQTH
jgi:hypothetical protein